jgi:hypothetical protein
MTLDEASAYLTEHALDAHQRLIYQRMIAAVPDQDTHVFPIVAHLYTDLAYVAMMLACPGNPEGCAERTVLAVTFIEALLQAKVVSTLGSPRRRHHEDAPEEEHGHAP